MFVKMSKPKKNGKVKSRSIIPNPQKVLEIASDSSCYLYISISTTCFPFYKRNLLCLHQKVKSSLFNPNSASIFQFLLVHMDGGGKDQSSNKKKLSVVVGPWGGNGGTAWDDGVYHGVREITLVYDWCIDSIRVVYDKNGKPVTAEKHGGIGGSKTAEIKLNFPEEYLISVSGHYCPVVYGGTPVIRSLTFKSNQRTFGPYGMEEGTPFAFSVEGARIAGFSGRSGWYLDSIGFSFTRIQSPKLIQKVQKGFRRLTSSVTFRKA